MKKALIKLFIQLIVLAILAFIVFAIGYVQFSVPIGKYAVLLSKTSGYYDKVISHEGLTWRWERLIPTNAQLLFFDATPITIEKSMQGQLENGQKYATILKNKVDFYWKIEATVVLNKHIEKIISTLKDANIKTEEELDVFLKTDVEESLASVVEEVVLFYQENALSYNTTAFKEKCSKILQARIPKVLKLHRISLTIQLPDFATYKLAKETYTNYVQTKKDFIFERIEKLKELQNTLQELSKSVDNSIIELSNIN